MRPHRGTAPRSVHSLRAGAVPARGGGENRVEAELGRRACAESLAASLCGECVPAQRVPAAYFAAQGACARQKEKSFVTGAGAVPRSGTAAPFGGGKKKHLRVTSGKDAFVHGETQAARAAPETGARRGRYSPALPPAAPPPAGPPRRRRSRFARARCCHRRDSIHLEFDVIPHQG